MAAFYYAAWALYNGMNFLFFQGSIPIMGFYVILIIVAPPIIRIGLIAADLSQRR